MMNKKIKRTFTEELYTPYLDLTKPVIPFALHSYKPLLHAAEHFEGNPLVWTMQRAIPASFRKELSKRLGRNIGIFSPTESNITSEPWEALIRDLNGYKNLTKEKKVSLLKVLFALGFYSLTYNLASQSFFNSSSRDELDVKLLQLRANAAWIQWVDEPTLDYNVAFHEELYSISPINSLLRFVTALHIAVFYVRWKKDYQKVIHWIDIAQKDLESIKDGNFSSFYKALMSSRFYRAQAFIPYLQENKEGALIALSESEYWANQLNPSTPTEELLKRENLFPLSESHGKTAVWAGELELAGKMYHRLVKTDPYDPKSHMEYAEFLSDHGSTKEAFKHYILANIYSPPGGDISIFMACQLSSSITPKTPQNLLLSLAANDNQAICAFEEIVENHSSAEEDKYLAFWGGERLDAMTN